jgi:hypothetical protein
MPYRSATAKAANLLGIPHIRSIANNLSRVGAGYQSSGRIDTTWRGPIKESLGSWARGETTLGGPSASIAAIRFGALGAGMYGGYKVGKRAVRTGMDHPLLALGAGAYGFFGVHKRGMWPAGALRGLGGAGGTGAVRRPPGQLSLF